MMTTTSMAKLKLQLISVLLFFGMTQCLSAAEYNEEQTAYNAAIKIVSDRGCLPVFVRTKRYEVVEDSGGVTIKSKENRATCQLSYKITWDIVSKRENGTDVSGVEYIIKRDGEQIGVAGCCEYSTNYNDGLTIQSVDSSGLSSVAVDVPQR